MSTLSLLLTATLTAVTVANATRVQSLPEVIDISIVPTTAGVVSIAFTSVGALCRFAPDRLGRLSLGGTVLGGGAGILILMIGLLDGVL